MEEEDIGNALVAAADEITPTEQGCDAPTGILAQWQQDGRGANRLFLIGCKPQIDSPATITYPA